MPEVVANIPLIAPSRFSQPILLPPRSPISRFPTIETGNALLANETLVIPTSLIEGFLHRNTKAILAGSSKAGKTWLLLDLALAVATGGRFLNWNATLGRVLFINLEIHRAFFRKRLQDVAKKRGLAAVDNLEIWSLRGQGVHGEAFLQDVERQVRGKDYALIIIDPIYKLMTGSSENSNMGAGLFCAGIDRLMERSGAAVVYAHHFTKGNQSDKKAMDRMSGSGVFARDADTIVTLTEHLVEGCFVVETSQRNTISPAPFVVEWEWPSMQLREDLDPSDLHDGKRSNEHQTTDFIQSLLKSHPLTTSQWQSAAAEEGVSRATFYRKLALLKKSGEVRQDDGTKAWYRPVPEVLAETCET